MKVQVLLILAAILIGSAIGTLWGNPLVRGAGTSVPLKNPSLSFRESGEGGALYLPFLHTVALVEAVETSRGERPGYPTYYHVYGYVRNLTPHPLYNATVVLEVTFYPYGDPPTPPYTELIPLPPALTATLPGQPNPFAYTLALGKASATLGPIRRVSASPWQGEDMYTPLTIVSWVQEGSTLSGRVRNDTPHTLRDLRVVVADLEACAWQGATLDTESLLPGQESQFDLDFFSCGANEPLIVGQGAILSAEE